MVMVREIPKSEGALYAHKKGCVDLECTGCVDEFHADFFTSPHALSHAPIDVNERSHTAALAEKR